MVSHSKCRATHASPLRILLVLLPLLLLLAGCLPTRCKELNTAGDKALSDRKYEQAISYYSRSLTIEPDQEEIRLRLDSAKTLLRQIYVDKIYEIVDRSGSPVQEFLAAWKMSATLPSLNVAKRRVASIRVDLSKRFAKSESGLRKKTEGHVYYHHLAQMQALVADHAVATAIREVGAILRDQHLVAKKKADKARMRGLALLHTTAAATFSPRDTGLWNEVFKRRRALLSSLSIKVSLRAQAARGGAAHLLGGLRRRLPPIFVSTMSAPLVLSLKARPVATTQRQTNDRRSADCKVGTRRVPNPECPALRRRAESARAQFESAKGAADAVSARCGQEANTNTCSSNVSSAQRRMNDARRHYEDLENKVGRCPSTIEKPIFKTFFYMRHTMFRQAAASAALTLTRSGEVISSRGVHGSANAQDTFGDGLGCANIASDPLQLTSLSSLRVTAENRMLDASLTELHQMRRRKAKAQLAGGDSQDQRFDSLVRARLVDSTFALAKNQLHRTMTSMWGTDFALTDKILK